MSIYVIRHGQTDWNIQRKIQGKSNIPLNEEGIKQAGIAKENLKNQKIDMIICSPLDRAKKTAEIINENLKLPLIINEKLSERNFGIYEGRTSDEIEKWRDMLIYDLNEKVEDGECIQEFFKRVHTFLDEINKDYSDKNILLVTHGGVARAIDAYYNGLPEDKGHTGTMLHNCGIAEYK